MRYSEQEIDAMRQAAAIDAAATKATTEGQLKEAPRPFGEYITVRQFCELTGASPGQVYYSINEAPVEMDAVKHGLWFIHVETAIFYASILKERRLNRAMRYAKAAQTAERRVRDRLDKARATESALDQSDGVERIKVSEAAVILGVSAAWAGQLLHSHGVEAEKVGTRRLVPVEKVKEIARERLSA